MPHAFIASIQISISLKETTSFSKQENTDRLKDKSRPKFTVPCISGKVSKVLKVVV